MVNQIEYIKNNPKIIMNDSILFKDVFGTIDLSSLPGEMFYLGIEFGSSAIKYCLYDDNGNPLKIGDKGVFNLVKDKGSLLLDNGYIPTIKLGENQRIVFTTFVSNGHVFKNEGEYQDELNLNTGILKHTFIKTQVDELKSKLNKTTLGGKVEYKELQKYDKTSHLFDTTVEAQYEIESANTAIVAYNITKEGKEELKIPNINDDNNDLCVFIGGESTQCKNSKNQYSSFKNTDISGIFEFLNDKEEHEMLQNLYLCSNASFFMSALLQDVADKDNLEGINTDYLDKKKTNKTENPMIFTKDIFNQILTNLNDNLESYKEKEYETKPSMKDKFENIKGLEFFVTKKTETDTETETYLQKLVNNIGGNVYCFKGLGKNKIGAITGLINELKPNEMNLGGGYRKTSKSKKRKSSKSKKRKSSKSKKRKTSKKQKRKKSRKN
jgi:hypothetical protein